MTQISAPPISRILVDLRFCQISEKYILAYQRSIVLMAEIIASAVVSETLSRISTFLIDKYYDRKSSGRDNTERLEMAHIKMEAALETSGKWPPVTDVSLLRWRKNLKRAADECDAVLNRRKRAPMEDTEVKLCSLPARIAHATKSLLFSSGYKNDASTDTSEVVVRRYERFADGAGEFLRFVELGCSVRRQMLVLDPLVGQLLAGRAFQYEVSQGSRHYHFMGRPVCLAERGLEAGVFLQCRDHSTAPDERFVLGIGMRVRESTDVAAIVAECLGSFTPRLKPVADVAKQELGRVHTRGMYCHPFLASTDPVYWNLHLSETRRARPDPLCCIKGGHRHGHQGCSINSGSKLPGEFPEPVIKLFVQRHFSVSKRRQSKRRKKEASPSVVVDHGLQFTAVFAPHAPTEELPVGVESLAVEVINGNRSEQTVHENAGLHELEEMLLLSANSRVCNMAHEVFWRSSGHGVAYLCVEKASTDMTMRRATKWQV
jgi:hypothetical protein